MLGKCRYTFGIYQEKDMVLVCDGKDPDAEHLKHSPENGDTYLHCRPTFLQKTLGESSPLGSEHQGN